MLFEAISAMFPCTSNCSPWRRCLGIQFRIRANNKSLRVIVLCGLSCGVLRMDPFALFTNVNILCLSEHCLMRVIA